jgi:hypothetical protein
MYAAASLNVEKEELMSKKEERINRSTLAAMWTYIWRLRHRTARF